jgi:hypothetical protein
MRTSIKYLGAAAALLTLGVSMNAFGFLGFGGTSWKEEVLLHDGSKIVAARYAKREGRHEIGQKPPIKEETLTFKNPGTGEQITWKRDLAPDVGYADLKPIALDVVQGIPYLVTTPVGCLAYNKWGRPNPPYVVYKYSADAWRQIELQDLPKVIEVPNLIISSADIEAEKNGKNPVPAADIARLNVSLTQPQYSSIRREALPTDKSGCPEMVSDGKGGWLGIDWFTSKKTRDECLAFCEYKGLPPQNCPCDRLFGKN